MPVFTARELAFARSAGAIVYCNPFSPQRIELEREALGGAFCEDKSHWNIYSDALELNANVAELVRRAAELVEAVGRRVADGKRLAAAEREVFEDLAIFALYHHYEHRLAAAADEALRSEKPGRIAFYDEFERETQRCFAASAGAAQFLSDPAHAFACFFQVKRAFLSIFRHLIGISLPAVNFRGMVWQSIFTHDMRRYRRLLFDRMNDLTTLITGPSGTGKELAARAVALSRYVPFDAAARKFVEPLAASFIPLNLSALSPTLIESELFGHRRGAFTGAVEDRAGWLETCTPLGTVFLDEIGELSSEIQVKLLRVLQQRRFQRIGDTKDRGFAGKIIAATNRDLQAELHAGRFRADFYYRICSDVIQAPPLRAQIADNAEELPKLVLFIARRILGEEAPALANEVMQVIERNLGPGYEWPGNVRELEQCVRNVLVRGDYKPPKPEAGAESFDRRVAGGELTLDELLRGYCTRVYRSAGSYEEAARRLNVDRRTARRYVMVSA